MMQVWVWMEARELASAAFVNADDLVKYDWYGPLCRVLCQRSNPFLLPQAYTCDLDHYTAT